MIVKDYPIVAITGDKTFLRLFQKWTDGLDVRQTQEKIRLDKSGLLIPEDQFQVGQTVTAYFPGYTYNPTLITLNGEPCYCADGNDPYRVYSWNQDKKHLADYNKLLEQFGKNRIINKRLNGALTHLQSLIHGLKTHRTAYAEYVKEMNNNSAAFDKYKETQKSFIDNFMSPVVKFR